MPRFLDAVSAFFTCSIAQSVADDFNDLFGNFAVSTSAIPEILDQLMPPNPNYGHEQAWHDGNGHSHLQATVMGPDLTVPISNGAPVLGTWQQIIHLECDVKPRSRDIIVTVRGD